MAHIVKRTFKELIKCEACGSYPDRPVQMYDWYSLFDGSYNARICRKCAIREIGPKNKKAQEKIL